MVLHLDTTAISNLIKYYLTANRVWLLQVCFADLLRLLLKEHLPRTQETLERDCLEHHCERLLKLCNWSSIQVSFFTLLTGGDGIVSVLGCGMHWYLTSYQARLSALTQTHSPSPILLKVCRNFKKDQHFDLFK